MSVRFIIGRSGYGKTHQCLQEIRNKLKEEPQGTPLIYLVPDQMTFQSERALATSDGLSGMIRAQVFSFSRLAWKVLQETGGLARTHLTSVGINMMLRKIIEKNRPRLHTFRNAADKAGFIDKTAEMLVEFKRYCIEPGSFFIEDNTGKNKSFYDKLHDLEVIYHQFERELKGKYIDAEDNLSLLAEKIPYSSYIRNAEIWVDGFHSFTPNEYVVLEALIKHAGKISFTLTMDGLYEDAPGELNLFHENIRNYHTLKQITIDSGAKIEQPLILQKPYRFHASSLAFLEKEYERRPAKATEQNDGLSLAVAVNRRAEVEAIAREILSLVRDHNYRYRDISIIVRNLSSYADLIETIFADYHLPYFLDEKRPMLNHPLIEFIRSVFDILTGNWRYEAIFRAVKTDFFTPLHEFDRLNHVRNEFDKLENLSLKFGLQGNRWKNEKLWNELLEKEKEKNKEIVERLLELRHFIFDPLNRLEADLKNAKTGRDTAEALYEFLIRLEVPEKLNFWLKKAEAEGDLTTAREHDQAWKAMISFLDEFVEIVGDDEMNIDLFAKIIESGLESMKFSLVPPALDQVLIGSLDRSRYTDVKCVFLIGANEGVLPAKPVEDGLLTEQERETLAQAGILLAPGSTRRLLDEQFYIYLALATAEDKLWVTYPLADEEGGSLFPSPIIGRLKELFPTIEEKLWLAEPSDDEGELDFITNPQKTLSFLSSKLRNWQRGYPTSPIWWHAYNWYIEHGYIKETQLLIRSLFYKNEAGPLSQETSSELYGDVIQVSVSRMETFQSCPFQQFASYGLRLRERPLFKLDAPDIGQLFHDSLNLIAEELRQRKMEWASLNEKQCFEIASRIVDFLAPKLQSEILLSSNRHNYLTRKLKQVVGRAANVLAKQARRSGFSPIGLELAFGKGAPLPPVTYELDNNVKIEVVGRIDRVDRAIGEEGMLLRVIDYKSSSRDLSLAEVYFGISMQMLTYLDVVITHAPKWLGKEATPAGVLYFHVHNPMLDLPRGSLQTDVEDELFKKFKMKGLVLNDMEAISLMDEEALEKDSDIIPVAFKKDGSLKKYSKAVSHDQFDLIRSHVRDLTKTIGTRLTKGIVDISPYRLKDKTPCDFCDYRPLCQFDQSIMNNSYRLIKAEKDDVILQKMMEERDANE